MEIEKTYVWNRGRKRRASQYEEITAFFSTPSVPFLADQESHPSTSPLPWHYSSARIGPPTLEGSRLQYEAWERFVDPDEMHYGPYVKAQARKEAELNAELRGARALALRPPDDWVMFLRSFLPPLRYSKWARVMALLYVVRFVPSSPIDAAASFQAFDELRATQRIIRHCFDLDEGYGGFQGHRAAWLEGPAWQPAREFAERLNALSDWGEILVACNLCLEPLLEPLVEEAARNAALNADTATMAVLQSLLSDELRHRRWTDALVAMLVGSARHGEENRAVVQEWLATWYPRAVAVVRGVGPMMDAVGRTHRPYAAFEEDLLGSGYPGLLDRLGLCVPAPVGHAEALTVTTVTS